MILSDNAENDLFIDEDLVNCSEHFLSKNLKEFTENTLPSEISRDRLSKALFRAAYEIGGEISLFEKIVSELRSFGNESLTVDTLKDKIVSFMIGEGITESVEEIKTSTMNINSVNQIIYCVEKIFDNKFVIYNNLKLAPIVIGNCISFNGVITFGMLLESNNGPIVFDIERITDKEANF